MPTADCEPVGDFPVFTLGGCVDTEAVAPAVAVVEGDGDPLMGGGDVADGAPAALAALFAQAECDGVEQVGGQHADEDVAVDTALQLMENRPQLAGRFCLHALQGHLHGLARRRLAGGLLALHFAGDPLGPFHEPGLLGQKPRRPVKAILDQLREAAPIGPGNIEIRPQREQGALPGASLAPITLGQRIGALALAGGLADMHSE